ncbi:NAD(P)H-quinone dehydrogenase [Saxibacter everestensis]|uniref:NAD(P)H-quinone dehydrogenase n=1 Tax=Saxibacter everestensis TaxID=2909229 RepID=A0ABY8QPE2_9MICO|nr:NAD(P)H-quinone dehydrogenase [Brevibacteriaceae bacterium ZFBP1038]
MNNVLDPSGTRIVIVGGGPGGYEAALVAAQLGAKVTLVERNDCGGSAVLTDVVPSKTLIATAELMVNVAESTELGLRFSGSVGGDVADDLNAERTNTAVTVDLGAVNRRVKNLARAQSADIRSGLVKAGVRLLKGHGRLTGPNAVEVESEDGSRQTVEADTVLVSVGAHPRELDTALPDGERIFTWTQLYELETLPEKLIVVGSGVTGAEFASAYHALGSDVTLISSRDRVLPGEDKDAAEVLENVLRSRGMTVLSKSRASTVERTDDGVRVTLADGRIVDGSHCLMAVGSIPNTKDLGLEEMGVRLSESGHIEVDGVSRTSVAGVYAAGDCTGVLPLASVAAMQGRIAMWHALGDAVSPLKLRNVSSNVFTNPEIATVGWTEQDIEDDAVQGVTVKLPLATNARAKMQGIKDGFVKVFCRTGSGTVIGGVVVGPKASELIFPIALALEHRLTVDQLALSFAVYPSLTGSLTEAARKLHKHA